jgi:uncharacterized protein
MTLENPKQQTQAQARPARPLLDRLFARRSHLPSIRAYTVRSVRIPLRDGIDLGADLYLPAGEMKGVLLFRGPYGRGAMVSLMSVRQYAGQGYGVLFVSSRGTADSGGGFDPMRTEAADGQDVVTWMRAQPWYPGRFATVGGSYLGFTQWALLSEQPEDLVTAVIMVGPHDFGRHHWGTGTFNLDFIGWSEQMSVQSHAAGPTAMMRLANSARRLRPVLNGRPIVDAADAHFGDSMRWVHERLVRPDLGDPFWEGTNHTDAVEQATVPILLLSGWQDIFIRQTFEQYERLHERGIDVGLTVGPWTHIDLAGKAGPTMTREALAWLDEKLAGRPGKARTSPVRVFVTGLDEWRELPGWPLANRKLELFLNPGELHATRPGEHAVESEFIYDAADPTPTVGGPLVQDGGYVDDTALGKRADVLSYTGEALGADVTVMGAIRVRLAHRTENPDADLFVRVSDVDPQGRSKNVTEGYMRLPLGRTDGPIELELLPTAHRFLRGHRIRLLVAGGSFPQYARNPGTGSNPLTATERIPNRHTISHANGTSVLTLPAVD